jgi:hypothetical protein
MSPALSLWSIGGGVLLVTSAYAVNEAERNLETVDSRTRLYRLLRNTEIADEAPTSLKLSTASICLRKIADSARCNPCAV